MIEPNCNRIIKNVEIFLNTTGKMIISDPINKEFEKDGWVGITAKGKWHCEIGYIDKVVSYIEIVSECNKFISHYKLTDVVSTSGLLCVSDYTSDFFNNTLMGLINGNFKDNGKGYFSTLDLPSSLRAVVTTTGHGAGTYPVYAMNNELGEIAMIYIIFIKDTDTVKQ